MPQPGGHGRALPSVRLLLARVTARPDDKRTGKVYRSNMLEKGPSINDVIQIIPVTFFFVEQGLRD